MALVYCIDHGVAWPLAILLWLVAAAKQRKERGGDKRVLDTTAMYTATL